MCITLMSRHQLTTYKDLHALILQDKYPDAKTPEELFEMFPTVLSQESAFLRKAVPKDFWNGCEFSEFGVYRLMNFEILLTLPWWNWKDVPNFFSQSDLFEMRLKEIDGDVVEC